MKFALATANVGKIKEMTEILTGLGIEVATREMLGIDFEVEETGSTFYENALLKAKAICEASRLPAIADDSGLLIDALDGAPGVYSSSFGGENLSDSERVNYLLTKMENMEQRSAKFVCIIVCVFPNGDIIHSKGECCGEILKTTRGRLGFGYDPVFRAESQEKSMAELPVEVKNLISHRGKALQSFAESLTEYIDSKYNDSNYA
jgi:XTP/dITP diphosphohydrolase